MSEKHIGDFKLVFDLGGCTKKVRGYLFIDREKEEYYARVDDARNTFFVSPSCEKALINALEDHLSVNSSYQRTVTSTKCQGAV